MTCLQLEILNYDVIPNGQTCPLTLHTISVRIRKKVLFIVEHDLIRRPCIQPGRISMVIQILNICCFGFQMRSKVSHERQKY